MLGVAPEESSFPSLPAASAKSAAPNAMAMTPSAEILKGRSVLVLDDEESLRLLLQEGLFAQGLRVDCAATTEDAVALIRRFWENGPMSLNTDIGDNGARPSDAVASSPQTGAPPRRHRRLRHPHRSPRAPLLPGLLAPPRPPQ